MAAAFVAGSDRRRSQRDFEEFVKHRFALVCLAHTRENGKRLGRPPTASLNAMPVRQLFRAGVSKSAIARQLQIPRTFFRRILTSKK